MGLTGEHVCAVSLAFAIGLLGACGSDGPGTGEGQGPVTGETPDGGSEADPDGGEDAGDSGSSNTGSPDAGTSDAQTGDGGQDADVEPDAGDQDASEPDAGDAAADPCADPSDCLSELTELSLGAGTLEPAFDSEGLSYRVALPIAAETVTFTLSAPAEATIQVEGDGLESGATWETPPLNLGDNRFSIVVSAPDQDDVTYEVTVARVAEGPGLAPEEAYNLALSGDTLAIGAFDQGEDAPFSGAVYVFVRDGDAWVQQARLKAPTPGQDHLLGTDVALEGDTLITGAPVAGEAHVFVRDGDTWSHEAILSDTSVDSLALPGWSVSLSGDLALVGSLGAGALVFERTGGAWSYVETLLPAAAVADSVVGSDVSVDGDTAVVVAPEAGAAYVYVRAGASFGVPQEIPVDGLVELDLEGDTLVAGSIFGAEVYVRNADVWSSQGVLSAMDGDADDFFGFTVALSGETVVVGAPEEDSATDAGPTDNGVTDSGAVYVFTRSGTTWSQQAMLKADPATEGAQFGDGLALSGDTIVAGPPFATYTTE